MDIQSLAQLPVWFTSLIVFLLGLAVGSFVNVVIYRVPRQMSIVTPGSRCPHCRTPIGARDKIPLLSYIVLNRKCRSCGAAISVRYPVVELLVGFLLLIVWRIDGPSWSLVPDWFFVVAMLALGAIDLEHRLLPDVITYPGFVLAVGWRGLMPEEVALPWLRSSGTTAQLMGAGLIASSGLILLAIEWLDFYFIGRRCNQQAESLHPTEESAYGKHLPLVVVILGILLASIFLLTTLRWPAGAAAIREAPVRSILSALFGAVVGAGLMWGLRLAYFALRRIEGLGFGDVKMMLMVGAYLGWQRTFLTLLTSSLLASIIGLVMVIRYRNRYIGIPYGIFLAAAAIVSLLVGKPLVRWYWGLSQP
jgi:prepilin signal peptidase PulO-like enzyme (type II secretory pathway)